MSVNLRPQKLTIFGVSNSGKTCLVGAIANSFYLDNAQKKVVLKGDSEDLAIAQAQIAGLKKFAPILGYPLETRASGGNLKPQTIRLNPAFKDTLLTLSLYDYRGGGLTDLSEGTLDSDFQKVMGDLYDSETILIVLDTLIMKYHPIRKWRVITAADFINKVLVELQLRYPNRKYDVVVAFTKFEASILYEDVQSTPQINQKIYQRHDALLGELVQLSKEVFTAFDMDTAKQNWKVSYIPVDVVGLGCEATTCQDFNYELVGTSFSGYRFGSTLSDERDVEPFNLDFLSLHLFMSMLKNRYDRLAEEIIFLTECKNIAQRLEQSNQQKSSSERTLSEYTDVKSSFLSKVIYWLDQEVWVTDGAIEEQRKRLSKNSDQISQTQSQLNSEKVKKLPDERDHILIFDSTWNSNFSSSYFQTLIQQLQAVNSRISAAYNDILNDLPSGKLAK